MPAVTIDVPAELADLLHGQGLTLEQVLTGFAHDLAETRASHGSDERRLANQWFARVMWPEPEEELDEAGAPKLR